MSQVVLRVLIQTAFFAAITCLGISIWMDEIRKHYPYERAAILLFLAGLALTRVRAAFPPAETKRYFSADADKQVREQLEKLKTG